MCSCSNDVFVELMGEEDAKAPVPYVGNCLFTGSQRRNNSARNGLRIFVGKVPRLTPNTCVCGAHFDGGKCQDTFSVPARLVWTKPPKTGRLSHVSQAARFLDEVNMEVDENIISAWKLAESDYQGIEKKSHAV